MPADPATAPSPWTRSAAKPGEPDYDAIYAAVVGTAEGRWFLAQYASRNRNADTAQVLAALERLGCEVGRERSAPAAPPPPEPAPPGPDLARLRRDLGEFADALMRARADIAAIGPAAAPAERPSILAATEALQGLAWSLRERGMDPRWCDRIDGCAGDIRAVCAIPDLTAQRTRAIVDVLGGLEQRLRAIRAAVDGGYEDGDRFGGLDTPPPANANLPAAAKPGAIEAKLSEADIAAFTPAPLAEIGPPESPAVAENATDAEIVVAPSVPTAELDRYLDGPVAADLAATPASPRLSHLLMAAELDRLLDAQVAATGAGDQPAHAPVAVVDAAEPVAAAEAIAPVDKIAPIDIPAPVAVTGPVEASMPVEATTPAACTEIAAAVPAPPPPAPRRVAEIAKDAFADVMALSEEERIALFT
jgi:hypothetical protein